MSLWVRLIGGPNNGEVKKIDDDQVDLFTTKPVLPPISRSIQSLAPSSVEIVRAHYTRRVVRGDGGDVNYFALEALSDFEALQSVLGP
jgi:hypothetical protein